MAGRYLLCCFLQFSFYTGNESFV